MSGPNRYPGRGRGRGSSTMKVVTAWVRLNPHSGSNRAAGSNSQRKGSWGSTLKMVAALAISHVTRWETGRVLHKQNVQSTIDHSMRPCPFELESGKRRLATLLLRIAQQLSLRVLSPHVTRSCCWAVCWLWASKRSDRCCQRQSIQNPMGWAPKKHPEQEGVVEATVRASLAGLRGTTLTQRG